jgi:S1-C subfamily serine protease
MRKAAVLMIAFVAVLYTVTLAFLFSTPPSVRSLVYRLQVTLSYREWADNPTDQREILRQEHKFSRINGSAVAISADGDLLTERHVVDSNFYMPWPCTDWVDIVDGKEVKMNVLIKSLELTVTASNGHQWRGTAHPRNPNGPWCDGQNNLSLVWTPTSDARIVIMDDVHDLALVSIRTSSKIPYIRLQRGLAIAGQNVKIGGFPHGENYPKIYSGTVMAPCEMNRIIMPMPVIRVTPRVSAGVSGGPVIVGNKLAGIIFGSAGKDQSLAVPGFYIAKWLDWVNNRTLKPPELVCSP